MDDLQLNDAEHRALTLALHAPSLWALAIVGGSEGVAGMLRASRERTVAEDTAARLEQAGYSVESLPPYADVRSIFDGVRVRVLLTATPGLAIQAAARTLGMDRRQAQRGLRTLRRYARVSPRGGMARERRLKGVL